MLTNRAPLRGLLACAALALVSLSSSLHAGGSTTHTAVMSPADIVELGNGQTMVTTQLTGDLSGRMTLVIRRDGSGALSGTWAIVESRMENRVTHGVSHEVLVQRGTLKGTLSGGTANLQAGHLIGFQNVPLQIKSGTLSFRGVTGSGTADGPNLVTRRRNGGAVLLGGAVSGTLTLVS